MILETEMTTGSIHDPDERSLALSQLVKAATWDPDLAERIARSIPSAYRQDMTLSWLADFIAPTDAMRASTLACAIRNSSQKNSQLQTLAESAGTANLTDAERIAELIDEPSYQGLTFATLAKLAASAGNSDTALRLSDRIETLTHEIYNPGQRGELLASLAKLVAAFGDMDRARRIAKRTEEAARNTGNQDQRGRIVASLLEALATIGDYATAEAIADSISDPYRRCLVYLDLTKVATRNNVERSRYYREYIERASNYSLNSSQRDDVLRALRKIWRTKPTDDDTEDAGGNGDEPADEIFFGHHQPFLNLQKMIAEGKRDAAEKIVAGFRDSRLRCSAYLQLSEEANAAGDTDEAQRFIAMASKDAVRIEYAVTRGEYLISLTDAAIAAADVASATTLATLAERAILDIDKPESQGGAAVDLVKVLAKLPDLTKAETAAKSIRNYNCRRLALNFLALQTPLSENGRVYSLLLSMGRWTEAIDVLAETRSDVLIAMKAELDSLKRYDQTPL